MTAVAVETITTTPIVTPTTSTVFADDKRAFKRIYRASRQAWKSNDVNPLDSYYAECDNALNLGDFKFGVEIEFDIEEVARPRSDETAHDHPTCDSDYWSCSCDYECSCHWMTNSVARSLARLGHLEEPHVDGYHDNLDYTQWRYEVDCSVTGGEVVTPILRDNAGSWESLRQALDVIACEGGDVTGNSVGGHINIGINVSEFVTLTNNFYLLIRKFEDVMYRLATNPYRNRNAVCATRHRGESFACSLASNIIIGRTPILNREGWLNVDTWDDRVEFRIFDGSLNPAVSQTYILIAAAFVRLAQESSNEDLVSALEASPDRPLGWHIAQRREAGFQARTALSGEAWDNDTRGVREFVDLLFDNDQDKERVITLYAMSDWSK